LVETKGKGKGLTLSTATFELIVPDLRNGAIASIEQAALRAGMSSLYHWASVKDMPAGQAVAGVEHIVRAHYAIMMRKQAPDAGDAERAKVRKFAVVLGGVRAGAMAAWRLTSGDMTISECELSGAVVSKGEVMEDAEGGTSGAKWSLMRSMDPLTTTEMLVLAMCAYIGMAVPVLQGASLIATGHHYIPPTYRLFGGLKRQALGSASTEVRTWVEGVGEWFDDLVFHKACHPINPLWKREIAKSQVVKQKLSASGHGSASIRLPAIPSEATGGKAMLALVSSAAPILESRGHKIDASEGIGLMMALESASGSAAEALACDAVVGWITLNEPKLAFLAGVVRQLHETTGVGRNTLLEAYSVKKLISSRATDVNQGVMYARAANSVTRAEMEAGTYKLPDMKM
jgi:hypothetical protein